MAEIKVLTDEQTATRIGEFLIGPNAFDQTWAPNEKAFVKQAPHDSLSNKNHRYWYIEENGEIIGAIGVRENKYGSGGYEMDQDYVAIHKNYRHQGIGTTLLHQAEDYVQKHHGRYIHIVTCDAETYKPARAFYEKAGYIKVAEIPNYYVVGEGRVDYFKKIL